MVLVLAIAFSLFVMPAHAAVREPDETNNLIYTYYVSRADCQTIYNNMPAAVSWSDLVKQALRDLVTGNLIGVGASAIEAIVIANYNSARNAFYKGGYVSGYSGCKVLVYDNASPTVLAY